MRLTVYLGVNDVREGNQNYILSEHTKHQENLPYRGVGFTISVLLRSN